MANGYTPNNYQAMFKATASRGSNKNRTTLQPRGGKNLRA